MPPDNGDHERYFMQSLAKGLQVLELMASARRPMRLTEITRATGGNNATTTRICHTLGRLGFVRRDRQRRFHLTPKVLALGYAGVSALGWRNLAQHYMEELWEEIKETVNLSVLDGSDILYVARINQEPFLPFDLQLGSKLPVYCTSMGKTLLAFSPPQLVEATLEGLEFSPLTHRTITDRQRFMEELTQVHEQGYAVNDEELSVGLRSVAAPVLDREGWALAALNIAVPTKRYSRQQLEEQLAPKAMEAARKTTQAIEALDA